MHHGEVNVYNRWEEDGAGDHVTVGGSKEVEVGQLTPDEMPGVSRRGWLEIAFSCEGCPASPVLIIAQHKGQTHVYWDGPFAHKPVCL